MKFGERQTHAVETDEWPGRGREKKAARGGEREEGDGGGDWKGRSNPPLREREGNSEGLKGREKEECWDSEEEKWLWKEKNSNLIGHKRIKVSIMHEMLGYFLANYYFGGFGSVFEESSGSSVLTNQMQQLLL